MKFTTKRESFLKPLQMVAGVVERRQTLPILSNVLLRVADNVVSLTGTDLEVELVARVSLDSSEAGEITVPARKLVDIFRELSDGIDINLELKDQKLIIRSGRFRSSLATLPATEFPSIDRSEVSQEIEMDSALLKTLIDRTSFAMAQQDVRYFLNGMLLEVNSDEVKAVATDGHRLAMCTSEIAGVDGSVEQVIIPRKGVVELQRLVGEAGGKIKIVFGANHVGAETAEFNLLTKLLDGKFPDYERVIPRGGDNVVVADRQELRHALNRTSILSNEKFRGIRVQLDPGNIQLSANNPEQEEAEESISVDYQGESLEIGFNVGYLLDVLGVLDSEQVRITLSDANSSALLEEPGDDGSVYVVMPMKL
jgi:DNA polymerase-3 subunit beta